MGHTGDKGNHSVTPHTHTLILTPSHSPSHPHTLTHTVVFMGSKKYPGENTFDVFTKRHGGFSNASTDYEMVGNSAFQALSLNMHTP